MGGKILIIDDDHDLLETMGSILAYEGFEIHSADSVERGIELIDKVVPDIILLDIMFPESKTRGFEAATEIKNSWPKLPIIVLTAINREYAFDFTKENFKADEFLNKPVRSAKLVEIIRKYVKQ
ncbi:MAG: response regulator [Spirochaetota bacterium]